MNDKKRKSTTSSAVKRRYNQKTYARLFAYVPIDLATAFKEKCTAEGVSQASVIKEAIERFLEEE